MEKAYQRINWINGRESLDTPLNANNLNQMDIALNTIDNRVVTLDSQVTELQGYETRAAQSAAEAAQSATSASNSATSASQSATSASDSATSASSSATSASSSATSATNSATAAATSETNAATSESNASTSATNAATSATNAATSETNAYTSEVYAEQHAEDSEAWAVGKRGGVDVVSGDDTYHNNSKYYSEQASSSATSASNSASTSSSYSSAALTFSKTAESYAKGGTNTRTGEDTDNAKYYKEVAERIVSDLGDPISPRGKCTFANLPAIADAQVGWMYQITDSFTPGNTFVAEDRGVLKTENTEVYLTSENLWACLDGASVTGVKGSAEQTYRKGQVNITPANLGLATVATSGSYNDLSNKPQHLGHSIEDSTTTFTDRANLKFTGSVAVTDDSTNDTTEIEILGTQDHVYSTKAAMLADLANVGEGETMYTLEDSSALVTRVENIETDVANIQDDVEDLQDDVTTISNNLSDLQLVRNGSNNVQFPSETTITIYYTEPLLADHTLVATTPRELGDDRVHLRAAYADYNNQRLYVELANPMSVTTTTNIKIDFLLAKSVTYTDKS